MLLLAVFMILPLPFGSVYKAEVATAQGAANDTVATKEFSLLGDAVIAIAIIVCAAYYIVLEARTGQTLGKKVVSIKVVAADGTPIGYRASFIRNMLRVVDGLPLFYVLGIICIIATRGRQRIGDRAAGTVMVIA